jgi:hypothetical protein
VEQGGDGRPGMSDSFHRFLRMHVVCTFCDEKLKELGCCLIILLVPHLRLRIEWADGAVLS